MKRFTLRTERGRALVSLAYDANEPAEFVRECLMQSTRISGARAEIDGTDVVVKAGPLARSGARRYGLRRLLLRAPAPCEAEFRNLRWLRERLFRVPEPIAAVTVLSAGCPVQQLLATRVVGDATSFPIAWRSGAEEQRHAWASEVGREVGRMHALRFLHGDLYPRNVLVAAPSADAGPGQGRALVWHDAWAGGPTAWRRGAMRPVEHDLGAWFSVATDWMSVDEQRVLLDAYVDARGANGRPVRDVTGLVARAQRARRIELAKLEKDRARLRGRPFPAAGWDPPLAGRRE